MISTDSMHARFLCISRASCFVFGCQYQCSQLLGQTDLRNDILWGVGTSYLLAHCATKTWHFFTQLCWIWSLLSETRENTSNCYDMTIYFHVKCANTKIRMTTEVSETAKPSTDFPFHYTFSSLCFLILRPSEFSEGNCNGKSVDVSSGWFGSFTKSKYTYRTVQCWKWSGKRNAGIDLSHPLLPFPSLLHFPYDLCPKGPLPKSSLRIWMSAPQVTGVTHRSMAHLLLDRVLYKRSHHSHATPGV